MSIIYEPKGKAREYSPLSANLYSGCSHACIYCYMNNILRTTPEIRKTVKPRSNIIKLLENDCKKYSNSKEQVLLCFSGDPYCPEDDQYNLTKQALELFLKYSIPVAILTKGGTRLLKDLDIIKKFGDSIVVGSSLTFSENKDSLEFESGAALPQDRIDLLKELKKNNIKTWASFEPVIKPEQSLKLIEQVFGYVDIFKIGKINNYKDFDKKINWTDFTHNVISILRNKKILYIKKDLRNATRSIVFTNKEMDQDNKELFAKPFAYIQNNSIETASLF